MLKIKTLSVFAGIIATLALSAAPAVAEFNSKQKQGNGKVIVAGEFVIPNLAKTVCVPSEIESQWHIQAKGQIKQQLAEGTKGPNLEVQVKNWGKCKTLISGKEEFPTTIKPCALRVTQQQLEKGTGGVKTSCLLTLKSGAAECNFQVPAGMETAAESGQGINVGLKEINFKNNGANLLSKVNINGGGVQQKSEKVFVQTSGATICSVGSTGTAELLGMELEGENLNA